MFLGQNCISLLNYSDLLKFMYLSIVGNGPLYCLKTWSNPGELSLWATEVQLLSSKVCSTNIEYLLRRGGGGAM